MSESTPKVESEQKKHEVQDQHADDDWFLESLLESLPIHSRATALLNLIGFEFSWPIPPRDTFNEESNPHQRGSHRDQEPQEIR